MTIRPIYLSGILALILLTNASQIAQAGVVMTIDNVTLTSGGPSKFVDVSLAFTPNQSITSISLNSVIAEFSIVAVGFNSSSVTFKTYADPVEMVLHNGDHQLSDSNYLFAGNSRNYELGKHGGTVDELTNTTFNGGDDRFDLSDSKQVYLSSTLKLLFRLEVQATGIPAGDELFRLSASPFTALFGGSMEAPVLYDFTVTGGDIRIASAAPPVAVPEPSTGIIMITGVGMLLMKRRRS